MNKLLQRQIEKSLGSVDAAPKELAALFQTIGEAYDGFEADRRLIERSLDISSAELTQNNQKLRAEVSERRQAEEKLQHSVSLLKATLEATADGILVVDRQGTVKGFNQQFAKLWRVEESLLAAADNRQLLSFVSDQLVDPQAFLGRVQQLYNEPAAESSDMLYFKDGRVFERDSKPQMLGREIAGRVWSFRDVTERVRAQERQAHLVQKLEKTGQQLGQVNKELKDFAYIVSHDLKAPLRGIKTLAEWITADYADQLNEEGREQLRLLLNRVQRMHNLIDGILQYSRIGRVQEEKVPVDLGALVPEIIDLLAVAPNITVAIEDELPVIECERTRITQVFQNLLSNAVKFMDKPEGRIVIGCTGDEESWTFRITDNGPGIEEKYHEKIFQLFQTLAPRDEYESTGIGLTLVKKIIEMYGGRVWLQSQPGEGTTFFFTLPRTQGKPQHERLQTSTAC